jgi:pantothenate synthetase
MLHEAGLEVEYVAVVHPETLEPLDRIEGSALLAIAVRAGEVRLIDNAVLRIAEGDPQASR